MNELKGRVSLQILYDNLYDRFVDVFDALKDLRDYEYLNYHDYMFLLDKLVEFGMNADSILCDVD